MSGDGHRANPHARSRNELAGGVLAETFINIHFSPDGTDVHIEKRENPRNPPEKPLKNPRKLVKSRFAACRDTCSRGQNRENRGFSGGFPMVFHRFSGGEHAKPRKVPKNPPKTTPIPPENLDFRRCIIKGDPRVFFGVSPSFRGPSPMNRK